MKNEKNKNTELKNKQRLYLIIASILAIIALVVCIFLKYKQDNAFKNHKNIVNEKFSFLLDNEPTELKNDSIINGEYKIYKEILSKFKSKKYTIDNPYVIVNPFYLSPQTALVLFKTDKKESVTVTIKGKHNDDLTINFEKSKEHILPIYGLYGKYNNKVIIKTSSGKTKELEINIEESAPTEDYTVLENKIQNSNGEFYFGTSSLGTGNIAFDNYGEVRWWLNNGYTKGMTMLQNGNLLLSNTDKGPDVTSTSGVIEVDMLGFIHKNYEIEGGYHHDAYELKNGNLIVLTTNLNSESVADYVVELDRKTGKVVKDWDLRKIVLKVDPDLLEEGDISWGWINSVFYDETSNSLILSLRNQNSVVAIDYKTSKINWILGEEKYWSSKFKDYLIVGSGEDFIYPMGQHSVNLSSDGKLSIFNNGYNAYKEESVSCKSLKNNASYAIVYNLDLKNKTATIDWKFGGQEYFSYALSSFTKAANGHKVFNSGWHFTEEVNYDDPSCTQFSNDKYDAYIIDFDENNNIVSKIKSPESKFEVVKANIYNLESVSVNPKVLKTISNYSVEKGSYIISKEADKYETLSEDEALNYKNSTLQDVSFEIHDNKFSLVGYFTKGSCIDIILISSKGKAYKYTLKEKNEDMRNYINLSGLSDGRYYLFTDINGDSYNTGKYIDID